MFSKTILAIAPLLAVTMASPAGSGANTLSTATRSSGASSKGSATSAAASSTGTGVTVGTPPSSSGSGACMTQDDAQKLVQGYIDNIAGPNFNDEAADKLIAEGATETSQTVLSLAGATGEALQAINAPNKTALLDTEKNKKFKLSFTLNGIDAVGCDGLAWRFEAYPVDGPGKVPFRGMSIFHTAKNQTTNDWQITAVYGEVNSFLLDQDLGGNCKPLSLPGGDSGNSTSASAGPTGTKGSTASATGSSSAKATDKTTATGKAKASATGSS